MGNSSQYPARKSFNNPIDICVTLVTPLIGALAVQIRTSQFWRIGAFIFFLLIGMSLLYYFAYKKNKSQRTQELLTWYFLILSVLIFITCLVLPVYDGRIEGQIVSEDSNAKPVPVMAIPEEMDRIGQGTLTDDSGRFTLAGLKKIHHSVFAFSVGKVDISYSEHSVLVTNQIEPPKTCKYPFKRCKLYKMENINFENNSSFLDYNAKIIIENVANRLKQDLAGLNIRVFVMGHASKPGSEQVNLKIGSKRAEVVRDELIKNNINPNRIHAVSFGENMPLSFGDSLKDHAVNRRVEFLLLPLSATAEKAVAEMGCEDIDVVIAQSLRKGQRTLFNG